MGSPINFFIIFTEFIILCTVIRAASCLRCRSDDGPSEAELKRVIRTCMRKFGDANFAQNNQQHQQQQQQNQNQNQQNQQQNRQKSRAGNRENYGYGGYEDSDETYDDDMQEYGNYNNNRQQNGFNRNGGGGSYSSSSSSSSSYDSYDERRNNRGRYAGTYNNRSNNYGGSQNQNNNWPYNHNNNNQRNYPNNNRGYNNNNYNNNSNNNNNNNSNKSRNNNNNGNNNQNNFLNDSACIVHCFFEEMHMLNNNNYPDRHKVLYILTKDMRDRDLRNFYTDTIQECFHYLETQRRRDQCQFSRDLINCMTEYAKGNCDDWNEFNMMFN